jgi:hypothetical protein
MHWPQWRFLQFAKVGTLLVLDLRKLLCSGGLLIRGLICIRSWIFYSRHRNHVLTSLCCLFPTDESSPFHTPLSTVFSFRFLLYSFLPRFLFPPLCFLVYLLHFALQAIHSGFPSLLFPLIVTAPENKCLSQSTERFFHKKLKDITQSSRSDDLPFFTSQFC